MVFCERNRTGYEKSMGASNYDCGTGASFLKLFIHTFADSFKLKFSHHFPPLYSFAGPFEKPDKNFFLHPGNSQAHIPAFSLPIVTLLCSFCRYSLRFLVSVHTWKTFCTHYCTFTLLLVQKEQTKLCDSYIIKNEGQVIPLLNNFKCCKY